MNTNTNTITRKKTKKEETAARSLNIVRMLRCLAKFARIFKLCKNFGKLAWCLNMVKMCIACEWRGKKERKKKRHAPAVRAKAPPRYAPVETDDDGGGETGDGAEEATTWQAQDSVEAKWM